MDIRIKEPLYITSQDTMYMIRPGTVGVEKNRVVFFYDVTRTFSVGYSRDFCLENPHIFQVAKTIVDREIPYRDIVKSLEELNINKADCEKIIMKLQIL